MSAYEIHRLSGAWRPFIQRTEGNAVCGRSADAARTAARHQAARQYGIYGVHRTRAGAFQARAACAEGKVSEGAAA